MKVKVRKKKVILIERAEEKNYNEYQGQAKDHKSFGNGKKLKFDILDAMANGVDDNSGSTYDIVDVFHDEGEGGKEGSGYASLFDNANNWKATKVKGSRKSVTNSEDQHEFAWEKKSSNPSDLEIEELFESYTVLEDSGNYFFDPDKENEQVAVKELDDQITEHNDKLSSALEFIGSNSVKDYIQWDVKKDGNKDKKPRRLKVLDGNIVDCNYSILNGDMIGSVSVSITCKPKNKNKVFKVVSKPKTVKRARKGKVLVRRK